MKKTTEINSEQLKECIQKFYEYFESGYDFEKFLKVFLERLGLDEVSVTQKSHDGGIDLKAVRPGIGDFSDSDSTNYFVQAKRYKPESTISVKTIRELRGTLPAGYKGVLITTAKYSNDSELEASNNSLTPIILIDGKQLVESCIDMELGFVFTPKFNKNSLDLIMKTNNEYNEARKENKDVDISVIKMITSNDIRTRILSIPKQIYEIIPENDESVDVIINNETRKFTINRNRRYLAGITDVYKKYNIIAKDGTYNPINVTWNVKDNVISISIENGDKNE